MPDTNHDFDAIFRRNLLRLIKERQTSAAAVSKKAGLNPRAVKDIEEGRTVSTKLSSIVALARALDVSVFELLRDPDHKDHPRIEPDLQSVIESLAPEQQLELLESLRRLTALIAAKDN